MHFPERITVEDRVSLLVAYCDTGEVLVKVAALRSVWLAVQTHEEVGMALGIARHIGGRGVGSVAVGGMGMGTRRDGMGLRFAD